MENDILINGAISDSISFKDRGLHYGDGVFETIAVKHGALLCWHDHVDRLMISCDRLGIVPTDIAQLSREAQQLSENIERAVIKIIITRGKGGRGYAPPTQSCPTRILARYPWHDFSIMEIADGVVIRICQTRCSQQPRLAGLKHLNRLEQVMARSEWCDPSVREGLMLDTNDNVIEGTMSNIFYVSNDRLYTPDLGQCGVHGIIRQKILSLIENVTITEVKISDLLAADEVFVCNSIIGIWPVSRIDKYQLAVGDVTMGIRQMLIEQNYIC